MGIKSNVTFYKAILAAGFGLRNTKMMETADGSCWQATLVKNKTKLVTVRNGGYGGQDEFRYEKDNTSVINVKKILEEFYALPAVMAFARQDAIINLAFNVNCQALSAIGIEARKAAILVEIPTVSEEVLGYIVVNLADTKENISKLKRKNRSNLSWIPKADPDGDNIFSVKAKLSDTPENRDKITKQYGNDIDVFIGDVMAGL